MSYLAGCSVAREPELVLFRDRAGRLQKAEIGKAVSAFRRREAKSSEEGRTKAKCRRQTGRELQGIA